ncbi:hypothetical protein [Streptomyces sp. NPDC002215]|uniref:hypothetical protein n=1 Tax=Streptomyces sp. NPDC002215 TaxID=3154412 RepID=UPI00331A7C68
MGRAEALELGRHILPVGERARTAQMGSEAGAMAALGEVALGGSPAPVDGGPHDPHLSSNGGSVEVGRHMWVLGDLQALAAVGGGREVHVSVVDVLDDPSMTASEAA